MKYTDLLNNGQASMSCLHFMGKEFLVGDKNSFFGLNVQL